MRDRLGRVIVTGATGFVGSALTQRLASDGIDTVCLVRKGCSRIRQLQGLAHVTCLETDFSALDLASILAKHTPDVVFHLAAAGVHPMDRDPEQLIAGNVGLTTALVQACAKRPPRRFLFAGSCSEYAPIAHGVLLREDHPLLPSSLYGAAKASAYLLGRSLAMSFEVPFVSLRLFGIFGPGEGPERLIPHLWAHFSTGQTPRLTPGEQSRDFTYIDDVVEALLLASTNHSLEPYRAYNVCSGRPTQVRDIAQLVARATGRTDPDVGLGRLPYRVDESQWIVGDPSSFTEVTGYAPRICVEEGISRMIFQLGQVEAAR
jgi:UDP-glucose 4-epimerase